VFKYLKAAFWVRQRVPLLGDVPLNMLLIPAIIGLSFIHPAFLLFGLAGQATLLWALASSPRFRRQVDLPSERKVEAEKLNKRQELLNKLPDASEARFLWMERRIKETKENYKEFNTPEYISETNLNNLDSLSWVYLKLLFARSAMSGEEGEQNAESIRHQIENLNEELNDQQASASVRKSKEATLHILEKRLKHFEKRSEALAEIDADLTRIEAQVELARDNSKLQAKPDEISMDVDLASNTMQSVWYYGEADDAIHAIDDQLEAGKLTNPLAE